ncbi:MAG: DUF4124 domain-containing protein [Betaproteobacteria bacterium]|jgi:hypothetical protein
MKPLIVLACLIAAALVSPAQADQEKVRMYKCTDADGKVYYSDKLNPDCNQGAELNRHGVTMKRRDAAKPAQPGKDAPEVLSPRKVREQERRDRALLATYTSEEEIDAARDRSLAIPAQGTKFVEMKLDKATQQLTALKKQADDLAAQKKPLPASLLEEVNVRQKEIAVLEAEFVQRKAQANAINAKFESEKQRYRELKGGSAAAK